MTGPNYSSGKLQPLQARAQWYRECIRRSVVAACIGLATLVSGCDTHDRAYFRDGIGTDLYTTDIAASTELQNDYLESLCRQSLSYVGAVPSCSDRGELPPTLWPLIVQAGMNDVDTRCDSYLSWLDVKKRENGAILSEIGAIRVAADALTNPAITTVSPIGLAAVAAAFGLATSTLGNVNSLLLQVDHTTVQSIVFTQRQIFRENVLKLTSEINNKPTAIHALRTYLTICMPMTISAGINAGITVIQQGNTLPRTFTPTTTIGSPFVPREPFKPRTPPTPAHIRLVNGAQTVIAGYPGNADLYTPEVIASILNGLCAPATELNEIGPVTQALLDVWENTDLKDSTVDGKINARERKVLVNLGACPTGAFNAFERQTFFNLNGSPKSTKILIDLLDATPPAKGKLPSDGIFGNVAVALKDARPRVMQVRQDCFAGQLKKLPPAMANQVTPDLMTALFDYAEKVKAAKATSPPVAPPPC